MLSLSCRLVIRFALISFLGSVVAIAQTAADSPESPMRLLPKSLPNGSAPGTMVRDSLHADAADHFALWRQAYEARTDLGEIAGYQQRLKKEFLARIGGLPDPAPLNAQITGTLSRDGYSVEKVLFESQPKFYVTAGLFLPDPEKYPPPWPAVVVVCGHAAEGKLQDGYQRGSALAALNGIAAMIVDPIGQGERLQILEVDGKPPKLSSTVEHTLVGTNAILLGWNTARWMIHDAMSAVDYLQSRADIRADRIGCMGNSGGGTQTSYLMALDDRITAAAPSCYLTSFRNLLETIGPQDAEQNIFGQIALGMDHADYIMMRAPKPTLIACATDDYFDIKGAWGAYRDAKRLFHRYGKGRNVELVEVDAPHGWHPMQRVASVQFMVQHLAGRVGDVFDPEVQPLTAAEMNVTPQGQVLRLPGAVSTFDQMRTERDRLAVARAKQTVTEQGLRQAIRETLAIGDLDQLPRVTVKRMKQVQRGALTIEPLVLQIGEDIWLPAVLAKPARQQDSASPNDSKQVTCLFLAEGKDAALGDGGEIQQRVADGQVVLAVDGRGVGESEPQGKRWYNQRFGNNGGNATLAYLLGESLVKLRAEDFLAVSQWIAQQESVDQLDWVASGELTIAALHAAALQPRHLRTLETRRGLTSWSDVVDTPLTTNQIPGVVHGALRRYDLPDLASMLGDRLIIKTPHDATDKPISAE